jgi:hypothetical protein
MDKLPPTIEAVIESIIAEAEANDGNIVESSAAALITALMESMSIDERTARRMAAEATGGGIEIVSANGDVIGIDDVRLDTADDTAEEDDDDEPAIPTASKMKAIMGILIGREKKINELRIMGYRPSDARRNAEFLANIKLDRLRVSDDTRSSAERLIRASRT